MAQLDNGTAIRRWVNAWAYGEGPVDGVSYTGGSVRLNRETGELIYHRRQRHDRQEWGPVTLARFIPRYKTFLLNGDGFTDNFATACQDELRRAVTDEVARANVTLSVLNSPPFQQILIPYLALRGGEIDPETIRPIAVEADRWENIYHEIPKLPAKSSWRITARRPTNARRGQERERTYEATRDGVRFRSTVLQREMWVNERNGRTSPWRPYNSRDGWRTRAIWDEPGTPEFEARIVIMTTPSVGVGGWVAIDHHGRRQRTARRDDLGNVVRNYGWWERVHHLGAALFSAVGEDGKRHKFISAFDEQETNQMYYLAQLPDRSGATTYAEAIDALAPPIVHAARAQGRTVWRQGDIFAVETTLTDEEIYANARTRVRREVALFNANRNALLQAVTGERPFPEVVEEEVWEDGPCPCNCGHNRRIGWGDEARHALMIYGTGHTASEVVVWQNGATYVRGIMHHDPHLEDPNRRREHVDVRLGVDPEDRKWHLAVRNQVPRRRRRQPTQSRTRARRTARVAS